MRERGLRGVEAGWVAAPAHGWIHTHTHRDRGSSIGHTSDCRGKAVAADTRSKSLPQTSPKQAAPVLCKFCNLQRGCGGKDHPRLPALFLTVFRSVCKWSFVRYALWYWNLFNVVVVFYFLAISFFVNYGFFSHWTLLSLRYRLSRYIASCTSVIFVSIIIKFSFWKCYCLLLQWKHCNYYCHINAHLEICMFTRKRKLLCFCSKERNNQYIYCCLWYLWTCLALFNINIFCLNSIHTHCKFLAPILLHH